MRASEELVEFAGGAFNASLNHFDVGGGGMVATQQVDDYVFVVEQSAFDVVRYSLADWTGDIDQGKGQRIECDDARMAWELLRVLREGCFVWQCGACDGWIFTQTQPEIGILRCSTCGEGGVDFRHASRHAG